MTAKTDNLRGKALEAEIEALTDRYFARCREEEILPTMGGLAFALGYLCREDLEKDRETLKKSPKSARGRALKRARARIEEANLQALYRRETSAGAKFILQSEFGYLDRAEGEEGPCVIQVQLQPEGEEEDAGKNSAKDL